MYIWLETHLRSVFHRHLVNEKGQDPLTWLLVLFVIWLIIAGRRLVVQ